MDTGNTAHLPHTSAPSKHHSCLFPPPPKTTETSNKENIKKSERTYRDGIPKKQPNKVGQKKCEKYCHLDTCHTFVPVAIETSGAIGPTTRVFLRELGQRLGQVTGEARSYNYLLQRLSVDIQRGNAASVLGSVGHAADLEDFF